MQEVIKSKLLFMALYKVFRLTSFFLLSFYADKQKMLSGY